MSDKKYNDQQLLFLGYLGSEAKGDIDEAMKMAGYAPSSKGHIVKTLKMEIIEVASDMLASNSIKAARSVVSLLDNPTNPGAVTILKAASAILDRAGVGGSGDVTVKVPQGGLIILPAKGARPVVEEKESEDVKEEI
jgi:hypothetical protein